jgi:hypothetical protein
MKITKRVSRALFLCGAAATLVGGMEGTCGNQALARNSAAPPITRPVLSKNSVVTHVYTSGIAGTLRFPIVNGVVSGTPDEKYANISYAFYVSRRGDILQPSGSSDTSQVNVYSTNGGQPLRSFLVPRPAGFPPNFYITAIAEDSDGFTYVGLLGNPLGPPDLFAIDVFAPGAHGSPQPIAATRLRRRALGMAFDISGDLFVAQPGQTIDVFQDPHSAPTKVRQLRGGPIRSLNGAIVIDSSNELYVGCGDQKGPYILAYPASATDAKKPDRTIRYASASPGQERFPTGVAVNRNQLYVAQGVVYQFDKRVGGMQQPVTSILMGDDAQSVWTAP